MTRSACVQVDQLSQLFGALKEDVEALLLQAPSVSLDELAAQLHSTSTMLQEQVGLVAHPCMQQRPACIGCGRQACRRTASGGQCTGLRVQAVN